MNYSKMSDAEIGRRVAAACKLDGGANYNGSTLIVKNGVWDTFDPCNNPEDAWPVIVENDIGIKKQSNGMWCATRQGGMYPQYQENPLRAAMMVFLHMQESANVQTDSTR